MNILLRLLETQSAQPEWATFAVQANSSFTDESRFTTTPATSRTAALWSLKSLYYLDVEISMKSEHQYPPSASETDAGASEVSADAQSRPSRRHATLYDAVAGRVLNTDERPERRRGAPVIKHASDAVPMAPDEVLFRRRGAPERYAEHDIYFAHERDLPRGGRGVLPDSDLLKAVHSYSSRFYGAHRRGQRHHDNPNVDERSMDETALLAFGILLEEAGREVLGRRGDLVFTEPAETQDASSGEKEARQSSSCVAVGQQVGSRVSSRKRRRIANSEAPDGADMVDY